MRASAVADLENFGGGDFKHNTSKLQWFFGRNRKFKRFFRPKSGGLQKKVFTKIESDFSAEIVRFKLVGGMHPEMEPNYSK